MAERRVSVRRYTRRKRPAYTQVAPPRAPSTTRRRGWSDDEIAAVVDVYCYLLETGERRARAIHRLIYQLRDVCLTDRRAEHIERKFENISRVLEQEGLKYLPRFVPRKYVPRALRRRVEAFYVIPLSGTTRHQNTTRKDRQERVNNLIAKWERQRDARSRNNCLWRKKLEDQRAAQEAREAQERAKCEEQRMGASADRDELARRATALLEAGPLECPQGNSEPVQKQGMKQVIQRLPTVVAWTLQEARGHCERCRAAAPFTTQDNQPYLEVHHVQPLAEGGPDTPQNAIALCPNCHREAHHGKGATEIKGQLTAIVLRREVVQP